MPIRNIPFNISVLQMAPFRDLSARLLLSHFNACTADITCLHIMEPCESQTLSKSNYIMLHPCRQLYQTNLESYQLIKSSLEAPVLYTSASTKINIMPILQCLMS